MSDMNRLVKTEIDWDKIDENDDGERLTVLASLLRANYEAAFDAGFDSTEGRGCSKAAVDICRAMQNEKDRITDEKNKHAEQLLADLKKEQAKHRGSRPERIAVPATPPGAGPVH